MRLFLWELWPLCPSTVPKKLVSLSPQVVTEFDKRERGILKSFYQSKGKRRRIATSAVQTHILLGTRERDLINAPTAGKSSLRAYNEHGYETETAGNHPVGAAELMDLLIFLNLPTTKQNIQAKPPNTQTSLLFT